MSTSHIVGPPMSLEVNGDTLLRQRCLWCGALLEDVNLSLTASTDGGDYPTWPDGAFLRIDGNMRLVVEPEPHGPHDCEIPEDSCLHLDPEVTR